MVQRQAPFQTGDRLQGPLLPTVCIVDRAEWVGDLLTVWLVEETSGTPLMRRLRQDQVDRLEVVRKAGFDGHPTLFALAVEAHRLGFAHAYDPYFALSVSRVDPLPHQLDAVYGSMLKQPRIRFLLADDAGAGKTIMAGLLIRELTLRRLIDRILIIAPANLCYQWRRELQDLFQEHFEIIRSEDVTDVYASNPWQRHNRVITSRDWAKRDDVRRSIEEADRWDLVIVDEAHGMATNDPEDPSLRYRLARVLGERTDHFLMMTATPHNGDKERFTNFLALLDQDVYSDVASIDTAIEAKRAPFYIRRLKEAMEYFPDPETGKRKKIFTNRTVKTIPFEISGNELLVYQQLTDYLRNVGRIARRFEDPRARAIGFMMALYQRRFASSPHALLESLERRRKKLQKIIDGKFEGRPSKKKVRDEEAASDLDDETLAEQHEEEENETLAFYNPDQAREELANLTPLLKACSELVHTGTCAKWEALKSHLNKLRLFDEKDRKLLVFTEHKETLDWIVKKLREEHYDTEAIHGGMKPGARDIPGTRLWAEQRFRDRGGAQVLVATEAAGEGINLQFCWTMVNWDVPWNPARLEQRIGRIHRYKQTRDCIAFNFIAINTREGQVLHALEEKLDEIRRVLGDKVFDVVGQVVPGSMVEHLMKKVYNGEMSAEVAAQEIQDVNAIERYKDILDSALEGLASRELNMGIVQHYRAEAKVRRLVPEVLRDFFISSADAALEHPVKRTNGHYSWKTPRALMGRKNEVRKLGDLGQLYDHFTFHKEALEKEPDLEWVTPGHPLYEAVRLEVLAKGSTHLSKGGCFYDPAGGPARWLDVYRYELVDGNGDKVDEQLAVIEETTTGGLKFRSPTIFLDLVPSKNFLSHALKRGAEGSNRTESFLLSLLGSTDGAAQKLSAERTSQAQLVQRHIEVSIQALIDHESEKIHDYTREQDKQQALTRIEAHEHRRDQRIVALARQGEVSIGMVTRLGTAYVAPLPENDASVPTPPELPATKLRRRDDVEEAAVAHVRKWEEARGFSVESVEDENIGYDLVCRHPDGRIHFVEVKGKTTEHDVIITPNEVSVAERLGPDYWLYVVTDPMNANPKLSRVQDPFHKLSLVPYVAVARYTTAMEGVLAKAVPDVAR